MFLFLLFVFSIVSSTYIEVNTKCICEELLAQTDCDQLYSCYWNENKCINIEDCSSDSPVTCSQDIKCAYLEGKCTKFTSCDQYNGDKSTCEAISIQCTSIDQKKCQKKAIPSCSSYDEDETNCNDQIGFEGECGFIEGKCQVLKQCSDIDIITSTKEEKLMKCYQNWHSCKTSNSKCVQRKCSDQPDISNCQYVYEYDPFDIPQKIQLCKWQDNACVDSLPKDLNEYTCFAETQYSYRWNPKSKSCQKCDGPQPDPPTPNNFGIIMKVAIMIFVISQ